MNRKPLTAFLNLSISPINQAAPELDADRKPLELSPDISPGLDTSSSTEHTPVVRAHVSAQPIIITGANS